MQISLSTLIRFFLVTGLVLTIAITTVLVLHRQSEVRRLIGFEERQNIILAQYISNTIWPKFALFVKSSGPYSRDKLRNSPDFKEFHRLVLSISTDIPVLKVKVYDLNGNTVYSSDLDEIDEESHSGHAHFIKVKQGEPVSKLSYRDSFSAFSGYVSGLDVIESYIPVWQDNGEIEAIFELYTDVSPLMVEISRDTRNLAIGTGLVFFMIYGLLIIIARHAYFTIVKQYADITDKNSALAKEIIDRELVEYALKKTQDELEQRVEQRTLELTSEINERKQAEKSLNQLSQAVEQSPAMTIITDASGRIEYINPRFTKVTGYAAEEVEGKTPNLLKSGETSPEQYSNLWKTITAGKEWNGEFLNRRKNGTLYRATASIRPIINEDGDITHFLGISEDITERTKTEEQIRKHQNELAHIGRVSAIGEMATSLAHELNQPLTVISGCAQYCLQSLRSEPGTPSDIVDSLEQAAEQAERANQIIRRVRNFIQKEDHVQEEGSINGVIRDVIDLLQANAREQGASIKLELADELPPVLIDSIQIQQVIVNLANNGIEAMQVLPPEDRVLGIRTRVYDHNTIEVNVHSAGPEISAEKLEKIFGPFFTTKSGGLGMGLSISQTIVEAHGGRLQVASNREQGTNFFFTLPVARKSRGKSS